MPLFLSTYVNKIDKKGRISVPAPFRATLASQAFQGVVLFRAPNQACLEGFDYATMEELSNRLDHFDLFSPAQDDLATAIFSDSVPCPFDSEGRIMVPAALLEYAGIGENATFVGLGRKFQIWDENQFTARKSEARENVARQGLTIPQTAQKAAPQTTPAGGSAS